MTRCPHTHVFVFEEAVAWIDFEIEAGECVSDSAGNSFPTGRYEVECCDPMTRTERLEEALGTLALYEGQVARHGSVGAVERATTARATALAILAEAEAENAALREQVRELKADLRGMALGELR